MAIRVTGMNSGMDTESIINQLASARSVKVNSLKKAQIKLGWKQDAWKSLNTKIYSFYTSALSDMRFSAAYSKKSTKVSNEKAATVTTSGIAANGSQKLSVTTLATSGFMTGARLKKLGLADSETDTTKYTADSTLADLGLTGDGPLNLQLNVGADGGSLKQTATFTASSKISEVVNWLSSNGLNANFDVNQQRIYVSSGKTGAESDFALLGLDAAGMNALDALGLNVSSENTLKAYAALTGNYADAAAYAEAMLKNTTDGAPVLSTDYSSDAEYQTALEERYKSVKKLDFATDAYYAALAAKYTDIKPAELSEDDFKKDGVLDQEAYDAAVANEKENYRAALVAANEAAEEEDRITIDSDASYYDGAAYRAKLEETNTEWQTKYEQLRSAYETNYGTLNGGGYNLDSKECKKIDGQDSAIVLNGVSYTSTSNVYEINGLTITALEETNGEEITLTTEDDYSGIYDSVKKLITDYNALINEMDSLYNAEAAKDYEPLLSDEKAEMSDKEVEEWEKKIKDALLRKDSTLSTVSSALEVIMSEGFSVTMKDGTTKNLYLSDFGINTLGYFNAPENERHAYHIDGDKDDTNTSNKDDTLMKMIQTDPDAVESFFKQLSSKLYNRLGELMGSTTYSSAYTIYDDKEMKSEYCEYNTKIRNSEDKLNDYIDKWYKRFASMETALAKLQSKESSLGSLLSR